MRKSTFIKVKSQYFVESDPLFCTSIFPDWQPVRSCLVCSCPGTGLLWGQLTGANRVYCFILWWHHLAAYMGYDGSIHTTEDRQTLQVKAVFFLESWLLKTQQATVPFPLHRWGRKEKATSYEGKVYKVNSIDPPQIIWIFSMWGSVAHDCFLKHISI